MNKSRLFASLVILSVLTVWSTSNIAAETSKRGKVTGGVMHSAPNWFKESFLDIAEDVEEAAGANKQKSIGSDSIDNSCQLQINRV